MPPEIPDVSPVPPLPTATVPVTFPARVAVAALPANVLAALLKFTALLTLVSALNEMMSALAPLAAALKLARAPEAVPDPVPPFATGTVPVSEMFGVAPPLEASGLLAVTLVTVPLPVPGNVWPGAKVIRPVLPAMDSPLLAGAHGSLLQNWKAQFGVVPSCAMMRN